MANDDDLTMPFGKRLERARKQAGMSRPVLGGLVGRSADWVKSLESGRQLPPRLPLLLRLAEVLGVQEPLGLVGAQYWCPRRVIAACTLAYLATF